MADALLQVFRVAYRPDSAKCVRVYPDNLATALALHTSEYDAPSGASEPPSGYARSPYDANFEAFSAQLAVGVALYEFILSGPVLPFEPDDEDRPLYETVAVPPPGWLTVRDVCADKDVNKSAVARAVEQRLLRVAMCASTRQRYVCPDADYDAWQPRRQTTILLRRRLSMIRGVIAAGRPKSLARLYALASLAEAARYEVPRLPPDEFRAFFERIIGPSCPRSLSDWVATIDDLLDSSAFP